MALEPITTSGPTVTVSTLEDLMEAYDLLSHQEGGGAILVEPGSYGAMALYEYGKVDGDQPVIIASADPDDPAHFTEINLRTCENVRIESVHVDSTGVERAEWIGDLTIADANNIQIVGSSFVHDESGELKALGEPVESFGAARQSSNILFQDNYVDGYYYGLSIVDVAGFEVVGNEFTNIQGDSIRGAGWQDGLISENYIHDPYPIAQSYTHSDMIQIWGVNAQLLTQNVTISDNILIATDAATQSIFIRSGELGSDDSVTSGYFQNITITNNLIYNSHLHGITVADTEGLNIDGNTLLYNPYAIMGSGDGGGSDDAPIIYTVNSLDVSVTNNITSDIWTENGNLSPEDNNQIVTFDDPFSPNYAGNHFIDPFVAQNVTLEDLYVLPTSPWFGTVGSTIGNLPGDLSDGTVAAISISVASDDVYEVTYDASGSFDASGLVSEAAGYSFHWTFADGTTAHGVNVTKLYDSGGFKGVELEIRLDGEIAAEIVRNFAVQTKDIFEIDFEDGVTNISDGVAYLNGKGEFVPSDDGTGYLIGDGNKLEVGRDTESMFELDSFGLALDITLTGDEQAGMLFHFYQTMEASVQSDGSVKFTLITDEDTYSMVSREPIFDDGETHRLGIAFDGNSGQLEMFADGESVSAIEAWGTTPSATSFNLVFGNTWQDSIDAIIDNVEMSIDPSVAGSLPEVAPPAGDPPTEDPPAEEPPAEDPGDRGAPRDEVEASGSSNFLTDLLDIILSIFGLGGDDDPVFVTASAEASAEALLSDIVPVTEVLDEETPDSEDDEDEALDLVA